MIQRSFSYVNGPGYELQNNAACYDFKLYGGANADAIELDDPTPIPDRGYWFNGECKFLTLEGFVPSLSIWYEAWLKPHASQGALFEYQPVVGANQVSNSYSGLYYMGNKFCYESHAQATEQCLDVTNIALYEWNTYTLSRTTLLGKTTVTVDINGV